MFEACVTSAAHARRALAAGADRVELCARIAVGGLTPGDRTVALTTALPLPVHVMIRPRAGDYVYTAAERRAMAGAVGRLARRGVTAFVAGALTPSGTVDRDGMRAVLEAAEGRPVTFHRAFDAAADADAALDALLELGVARILTSGGGRTAWAGRTALARLVRRARGRIGIIGAGSVRARRARALAAATGVRELHAHVDGTALRALGRALS